MPLDAEHKQQLTDGFQATTRYVEENVLGDLSPIQIVMLSLVGWVVFNYVIATLRSLS